MLSIFMKTLVLQGTELHDELRKKQGQLTVKMKKSMKLDLKTSSHASRLDGDLLQKTYTS